MRRAIPDHVQDHFSKSGIDRMPVGAPIGTDRIHLHRAAYGRCVCDLDNGIPKIRAGFVIPESGVQHPHRTAIQRTKRIPLKTLALPQGLQQPLRRRLSDGVSHGRNSAGKPPL
jgi:hypothetical protein